MYSMIFFFSVSPHLVILCCFNDLKHFLRGLSLCVDTFTCIYNNVFYHGHGEHSVCLLAKITGRVMGFIMPGESRMTKYRLACLFVSVLWDTQMWPHMSSPMRDKIISCPTQYSCTSYVCWVVLFSGWTKQQDKQKLPCQRTDGKTISYSHHWLHFQLAWAAKQDTACYRCNQHTYCTSI